MRNKEDGGARAPAARSVRASAEARTSAAARTTRRQTGTSRTRAGAAPRARQQRTRDTREKILGAALRAFAEVGFDGARTRDIAARAGVNQGLITYHFASKEALWKAAVDHIFRLLRESFASRLEVLEEADPLTRLRIVARHFVRFAAEHPELHGLMVQEDKCDGPRMEWLVDRHVRPLYETSQALITAAQAEGMLQRISAAHLHYIFVGAASHLFIMAPEFRRLTGRDPQSKDSIEAHANAIVDLLFGAS